MSKRIFASLILLLLASCNLPGAQAPTSSAPPSSPAVDMPTSEIPTMAPEQPTATEESTEAAGNLEAIVILQPGPNSSIVSPVTVQGQSRPTFEQNLVVAVYSEDGGLLAQQPTTLDSPAGQPGNFNIAVPFSVSWAQAGRVSVYETSAMDGGILHLSSVELNLLPGGSASIQSPDIGFESIDIQSPAPMAEISGGVIQVSGFSDYYFESNLAFWICGGGGTGAPNDICGTEDNILATGNAMINAPDVGQPGPFSGELSYSVAQQTQARIVIFAASPRDGGILHLNSIPILLSP